MKSRAAARPTRRSGVTLLIPQVKTRIRGAPFLGSCAATIDGSGKRGFVIFGKPAPTPDALAEGAPAVRPNSAHHRR